MRGGVLPNQSFERPNFHHVSPFSVTNFTGNNVALYDPRSGSSVATIDSQISGPQGAVFDSSGNLFVANKGGTRSTGWVSFYPLGNWQTPKVIGRGVNDPVALSINAATGDLYVANKGNDTVSVYSASGSFKTAIKTGISQPEALAFNKSGDLFVANKGHSTGRGSVTVYSTTGVLQYAVTKGINGPLSMAFDATRDRLYVANNNSEAAVSVYHGFGAKAPTNAILTKSGHPVTMMLDSSGNVFVAYYVVLTAGVVRFEIREYEPHGYKEIHHISNNLSYPNALAFDTKGNLYVSNAGSNNVAAFAPGSSTPFLNFVASSPRSLSFAPPTVYVSPSPVPSPSMTPSPSGSMTPSPSPSPSPTPRSVTWATFASMPAPRDQLAAAVTGNILYAVGGDDSGYQNQLWAYDPSSNAWTTKASMPTHRAALGAGVVNGILYAIGGQTAPGVWKGTVEAYNPSSNSWTEVAQSMPTAREFPAIAVINNILYAVGGDDSSGPLTTAEAYDPLAGTWSAIPSMHTARSQLAVGVVNNVLYAIGGQSSDGSPLGTVEAYDPVGKRWTVKSSMPTARAGLTVSVVNNILYAIGGANNNGYLNVVEAYDPSVNAWSEVTSMPTARNALASGVINNVLYAVGGTNNTKILTTVEGITSGITPTPRRDRPAKRHA